MAIDCVWRTDAGTQKLKPQTLQHKWNTDAATPSANTDAATQMLEHMQHRR
jgi:hypothetical protein